MTKRKKRTDVEGEDYVVKDGKKRTGAYERDLSKPKQKSIPRSEWFNWLASRPAKQGEWFDSLRDDLRDILREYGIKINEHGLADCNTPDPTDATIPEDVRDAYEALVNLHGLFVHDGITRAFLAGRAVERLQVRGRIEEIIRKKTILTPRKGNAAQEQQADKRYRLIVTEYWKERPGRNHNSTIECLRKRAVASESTIDRALARYAIKARTDYQKWQSKNTWFTPYGVK